MKERTYNYISHLSQYLSLPSVAHEAHMMHTSAGGEDAKASPSQAATAFARGTRARSLDYRAESRRSWLTQRSKSRSVSTPARVASSLRRTRLRE